MNEAPSRFGINLAAQLVLALVLTWYASSFPPEFREAVGAVERILYFSFWFGLIYGFFRLCGSRGGVFEWYYQHVPFGLLSAVRAGPVEAPRTNNTASSMTDRAPTGPAYRVTDWGWDQLLTPRYIRFAGILLIVSALFSFFFRIRWDALDKIIAADFAAAILLGVAELSFRRTWKVISALSFLVAYALFQFSLTLIFSLLQDAPQALLAHIELWLSLKVVAMILGLPLLRRYSAEYSAIAYVCISYSAPLTVYRVVPIIDPVTGLMWTIAISLVTLYLAIQSRSFELSPLNSVLASVHAMIFYGSSIHGLVPAPNREVAVAAFTSLVVLYLMQLGGDLICHFRERTLDERPLVLNAVISHAVAAVTLAMVQPAIPALAGYEGVTWLGLSLSGFTVCLSLERLGVRNRYTESLLHVALSLSALGLFVQTKGAWTAVIFLLYSCVVLYASLLYATKTTKIFAFFVLTLSLFKLYVECAELFDSISGTTAVFVIGCLLLLLSNRFDSVKRLVQDAAKSDGESNRRSE